MTNPRNKHMQATVDSETTYEFPLNERARCYLRLEHLFSKAGYHIHQHTSHDHQTALFTLLNIVEFFERTDIKTELLKDLDHHSNDLNKYRDIPHVDSSKLEQIIEQLLEINQWLLQHAGKIGYNLRKSEFLSNIRQRYAIPAGTCSFDLPGLHYFLALPFEDRHHQLLEWFTQFRPIYQATKILLQLSRETCQFDNVSAEQGFYQQDLPSDKYYQFLRIKLPQSLGLYPEVSGGKQRFAIRFLNFTPQERAQTSDETLEFALACCIR